jgi:hypothetical protein
MGIEKNMTFLKEYFGYIPGTYTWNILKLYIPCIPGIYHVFNFLALESALQSEKDGHHWHLQRPEGNNTAVTSQQ